MRPSGRAPDLAFYATILKLVCRAKVPFLVGGTYAMNAYLRTTRETKDVDIFCRPGDFPRILKAAREGIERISQKLKKEPGCFVAGTLIATAAAAQPIETIQVGDRVLTNDPSAIATEVDPATWKKITLRMPESTGATEYYRLCEEVIDRA